MPNIDAIIKEMRNVPDERLEEVYQFIHTLNPKFNSTLALKKKILSYAGIFSKIDIKDYNDYIKQTKKVRRELFNRDMDV